MKQYILSFLWLVISAILFVGCSGSGKTAGVEHDTQTRYLSSTGSDFMRDEIKKGLESIKRLHNSVSYRTYQFDLNNLPVQEELVNIDFDSRAVQSIVDHHSKAGSALILSNRQGRTVLLTASHTVTFPDTIWHFAEGDFEQGEVEAVSVRQSVSRVLVGSDDVYEFEMVANDPDRDLAILARNWRSNERPRLTPLSLQTGNSEALDWTDRIYALGYPLGIEMVTSAMISKPRQIGRRGIVLNASFNRGFSGGSIFAVRGDGSGMEWVGMISSASGETRDYLIPEQLRDEDFRPNIEYTGAIYTQRTQQINYGITFAVGMEQIKDFYLENRDELGRLGISISALEE